MTRWGGKETGGSGSCQPPWQMNPGRGACRQWRPKPERAPSPTFSPPPPPVTPFVGERKENVTALQYGYKKWPNYVAGVYLNSKADLEHLQIANLIVYVWPLTLASQTGVCECVRHLSHRTSVQYFCLYSLFPAHHADGCPENPKRSSVFPVQSHFNHFTSILSLPSSEAHFKLRLHCFTELVPCDWPVRCLCNRGVQHFTSYSDQRVQIARFSHTLHCVTFYSYCVSPLEALRCFSSQLSPAGIKGFRESGTAYIRPKTMESRMSGEWYVTSFSPREMEILELCSFGCTAGDLALLLALALWFNPLSV